MNPKQIVVLLGVLALCLGGVLLVNNSKDSAVKKPSAKLGDKVFADLPINEIEGFSIEGEDGGVEVKRDGDRWAVVNRGGYAADFSKVTSLVRGIADLKVSEEVQAGESQYARLEVVRPGDGEEGLGTSVVLNSGDGGVVTEFVLGKEYEGGTTSGPFGSFASSTGRFLKNSDGIYIVSDTLTDAAADPATWLDKEFFKVQKIQTIKYTAEEEADSWELTRSEEVGEYFIVNPVGEEILDQAKAGPLKNSFSSPSFKDVAADTSEEVTGIEGGRRFEIATFEGFQYDIRVGNTTEDGDYYLTVSVEADFPTEYVPEAAAEEGEEPSEEDKAKAEAEAKQKEEAFKNEVVRKQEKLETEKGYAGVVFVVNKWSVESLLKKRSELLQQPEEEAEGAGTPAGGIGLPGGGAGLPSGLGLPAPGTGVVPGGAGSAKPRITAVTPPIEVPLPKPEGEEGESTPEGAGVEGAEKGEGEGTEDEAATEGESDESPETAEGVDPETAGEDAPSE